MKKFKTFKNSYVDSKPVRTSFRLTKQAIDKLTELTQSSPKSSKSERTYKEVFAMLLSGDTREKFKKKQLNKENLGQLKRSIVKSYVLDKGTHRQLTALSKDLEIKRDLIVEALVREPRNDYESERERRLKKGLNSFIDIWIEFQKKAANIFNTDLDYDEDYPVIDVYDLLFEFGETYIKHWKLCNSKKIEMDVTTALPSAIEFYQDDVEELNE
jgi:hypothetical protein